MNKLNQKGFTLIELLVSVAILITIMAIAIPSISSLMSRNDAKVSKKKKELLQSYAEQYVSDNKNELCSGNATCETINVELSDLKTKNYITDDDLEGITNSDKINFTCSIIKNECTINE